MGKPTATYESLITVLKSISSEHGDSASVRLKDGNLKFGQGSHALKNLFHGNRYQNERQAAVKKFGIQGKKTVSVAESRQSLQRVIMANTQDQKGLTDKQTGLKSKESQLKQDITNVNDQLTEISRAEYEGANAANSSGNQTIQTANAQSTPKVLSDKDKEMRNDFSLFISQMLAVKRLLPSLVISLVVRKVTAN